MKRKSDIIGALLYLGLVLFVIVLSIVVSVAPFVLFVWAVLRLTQ